MPRIRPITLDEAEPQIRVAMERNLEVFGRVLPSTEVYGHAPSVQEGARALDAGITAGRTHFTRASIADERTRAATVGCPF